MIKKARYHGWMTLLLVGTLLGGSISAGAQPPEKAKVHTITIEAMQFSPKTLEVNIGDTVIWKNNDLVNHTATADNKAFSSGDIPINRSWKFVAQKKGTLPYSCMLHPTMKGILVVK